MNVHTKILKKHHGQQENELDTPKGIPQYAKPSDEDNHDRYLLEQLSYFSQMNPFSNIRVTSQFFPKSKQTAIDSGIPMAAIIQPYGPSIYDGFTTTSYGNHSIVRCDSCKAYINPFMEFTVNEFRCNLCNFPTMVPEHYQVDLDPVTLKRVDTLQRPELHLTSYDIKAGQEYQARPPMPPTYMFMIDVSKSSVNLGVLDIFSQAVKSILNEGILQGGSRTMIGFITYDTGIQVYNLKPSLKQPSIYCIGDLTDLELPIPDDLLFNFEESKDLVINLVERLPQLYQNTKVEQATCFSKALQICRSIMGNYGGKLIIVSASQSLVYDPFMVPHNTNNPNRNYILPSSPDLANIAHQIHNTFTCPSIFVFAKTFVNTVTLTDFAKYLNGDVHYYNTGEDQVTNHFYYDLYRQLSRDYTWESVFRVRVSMGFKIKQVHGFYSVKSSDLLNLTCMDDSKHLMYELEHESHVARTDVLYMQTALLYTSSKGERRIRIHNYAVPLTIKAKMIHEHADSAVISTYFLKQALYEMPRTNQLNEVRTNILTATKKIVKSALALNESQLPPSLESLAMNVLGLMKTFFLTHSYEADFVTDAVNIQRQQLLLFGPDEALMHLVPYLFRIDDCGPDTCYWADDGSFVYPQLHSLSLETLHQGGLFLMDVGNSLLIYVAKDYDTNLVQTIFGTDDTSQLTEELLNSSQTDESMRLIQLISALRLKKFTQYTPLIFLRSGDPQQQKLEQQFLKYLILDDLHPKYKVKYESFYQSLVG